MITKNKRVAIIVFVISSLLVLGAYIYSYIATPESYKSGLLGGLWVVPVIPFLFIWIFSAIFLVANLRRNAPDTTGTFTGKNVVKAVIFIVIVGALFYVWAMSS